MNPPTLTLAYSLDTSALVKHYHQEEGTDVVERLFRASDRLIISDLSIIEFYSAIGLKVRTREITAKAFVDLRKLFANDLNQGIYEVLTFGEREKNMATRLLIQYAPQYALKTLDAIQLAVIKSKGTETISAVVCADERFCRIIEIEGFKVINPMREPPAEKAVEKRQNVE